jgi:RHS repeat-associated protein
MKINTNKFLLRKKPFLFVLFFIAMLVSASFNKEDRQKIREFKKDLMLRLNLNNNHLSTTDAKDPPVTTAVKDIWTETDDENSVEHHSSTDFVEVSTQFSNLLSPDTSANKLGVYTSKEKQGTIGILSDKEVDKITDNFFTIEIPNTTNKSARAYLEYDLFGLANHQSVSRSINHNIAIGGDIIIPSAQWSHQKEEINSNLIKAGLNTIMFTSPTTGVKYKIKDLKVVFEEDKQTTDHLVINSLLSGDNLYIKGSYTQSHDIFINNEDADARNGEFEKSINLSDKDRSAGVFTITSKGISKTYRIPAETKAFKIIRNNYTATKSIEVSKDQANRISYEGASITFEKESTDNTTYVELSKLRGKDIPATNQGIKNITLNSGAYRVAVAVGKLTKSLKVTIPYDEKKLGLLSPKEIKTFYFDYTQKQWKIENSAIVDEKTKTVTIESKGNNDYINGVISVPESPQLNAFAPTSISGLKTGNPVAGIQLISAPSANQQGTASTSYAIECPSGLLGMNPNISVNYSSSGGNGWMGEGWDVSGISSITLDTRWGTPTFDSSSESEIYLLDGEMLIYQGDYLPHRHNTSNANGTFDTTKQPRNSSGVKNFYLRKNNNFLRIERYGNNPSNYRWIVTTTNGIKKYFGGNENNITANAVVTTADAAKKIVEWGITEETDRHNNNIRYYYDNSYYNDFVGEDENLNGGKSMHIQKITYTGKDGQEGPYSILFNQESLRTGTSPAPQPLRPDISIDARQGVKRIEPKRLISVQTLHEDIPIKTYTFQYLTGDFYKSLLSSITTDGINYQLDYYSDTRTTANALLDKDVDLYAPNTDAFSSAINSTLTPSKISSNNTSEWGWALRIGAGLGLFYPHSTGDKNFMVSAFTGESYPNNKGAQELIDFNGDGVPDVLYRKRNGDNGIKYYPGSLDGNGHLQFADPQKDVLNLRSNFARTTGTTWNAGATVLFNWWKLGFDFTKSWSESESETPVYIIDANNDGLPDVVNDEKVWFNEINSSGQSELVTTSEATENMVITGNTPIPYTEPVDPADENEEPVRGKNDVVKVWIAPKSGYISISDNISITGTADPSAMAIYSIEIKNPGNLPKNGRLYLTNLNGSTPSQSVLVDHYNSYPSTPLGINNSSRIFINSGEKVFFRLHKKTGTNYIVETQPAIQYVNSSGSLIADTQEEEQDNFMPNSLKYEESFLLNNLIKSLKYDHPGIGNAEAPGFYVPALKDEVTYSVVMSKVIINNPVTDVLTLYSKTYPEGTIYIDAINVPFGINFNEQWNLKFIVQSDSYMDKSLEWKNIEVNNFLNQVNDVAAYSSYYVKNFGKKYNLQTDSNIPAGSNAYSISINKNSGLIPSAVGSFTYIIKKNGHVLGKRAVSMSSTGITESTITGTAISGLDPIAFYTGDPSLGIAVADQINILVYCNTYPDRAAYEALRLQLDNHIFNIYQGTNTQPISSTVETSLNTAEFSGISAVYHNWGQFIYNSNQDVKPGSNPLTPPQDPKDWDLQTGPVTTTGPDYVLNPDTPKDQYGMLINNNFFDAPFGQLNYNYSACAGNLAPSVYGDCVGDIIQANFQATANNIVASFSPVIPFSTYYKKDEDGKFLEKWAHQIYTEQYSMPTSFRDEEIPAPFFVDDDPDQPDTVVSGNINTQMFAISKKQKSKSKTTNWGIGLPVVSQSTSQLTGYGDINTQDFFDVNGDGYPDMLYRTQSQLTNSVGGLKNASGVNLEGGGDQVINSNDSFQKANTLAFTPTAIKTVGRMLGAIKSDAKADSSSPWSGGLGFTNYPDSYDKGLKYWMDVNGDGLADKVETINNTFKYKLNYGNGNVNSPFENYNGLVTNISSPVSGTAVNIGGGLSGMLDVTATYSAGWGVSGSLSGSSSTGSSKQTFQDVNGDGLVDIVNIDGGTAKVSYNMGNKFAAPEQIFKRGAAFTGIPANLSNEVRNYNGALTLGGGFYVNLPVITIFGVTILYFRAGADVTANLGTSVSEINTAFRDVNADGFPDLVSNTGSGFTVNYSRIGRTNKLAKVTETITNGTFSIDYGFSKPSYQNPNAKLVMTEVKILNPNVDSSTYSFSTTGKDIVTKYAYANPRFDRRERDFYGFETVISTEMNGPDVESKTIETFYNTTYFNNGLHRKTEVFKGDGVFLASESINTYKLYKYINGNTQIQEIPTSQFNSYDVGGTEGRRMAAILPSTTTNRMYESSGSVATVDNMGYNDKAQLITTNHISPGGNYSTIVKYHDDPSLSLYNILNIPSEIKVFDDGNNLIRQRNTIADYSTGDITDVLVKVNAAQTATTHMRYNADGNIERITYPDGYYLDYEYEPMGKYVTLVTNSFGVFSSAVYDPKWDAVLEATDVTGNQIEYTYDTQGRITSVLAPKEVGVSPYTIQYSYFLSPMVINNKTINLHGVTTQNFDPINPANPVETITLSDFTGRVIQTKKDIEMPTLGEQMSVSGLSLKDARGRTIKEYHPISENKDAVLNKKLTLSLTGNFTSTIYDALDRIARTTDEEGNDTNVEYNVEGNNLKQTITQMQNSTTQLKSEILTNAENKTVATINYLGGSPLTTLYTYNVVGELVRTVDAENTTVLYNYDLGGRRIEENHPDHGQTRFEYDVAGNLIKKYTANLANSGLSVPYISYRYDLNRLIGIDYPNLPDGSVNPNNVYYLYGPAGAGGNDIGRLINTQDGSGITSYHYGNMGEITEEIRSVSGINIPSMTFFTSYKYDTWNRLKQITYPDLEEVSYSYDLGGNLKTIDSNLYGQYVKDIQYDEYEQRSKILFGNDTYSTFLYKPTTRLLDTHILKKDGYANYLNGSYTYDNVGNVMTITNSGVSTPNLMGGSYQMVYGYDQLNRLISSDGSFMGEIKANPINLGNMSSSYSTLLSYRNAGSIDGKRQNHVLDGVDNPTNTYDNSYSYINGTHKIEAVNDLATGNHEEFEYDFNGNPTTHQSTVDGQKTMYWDEEDNMKAYSNSDQGIFQYFVYDDNGERTIKYNLDAGTMLYQNGALIDPGSMLMTSYKIYPNPYIVISSDDKYTKHYYAGSERIASRLDDNSGIFNKAVPTSKNASNKEPVHPEIDLMSYLNKAGLEFNKIDIEFATTTIMQNGLYYLHGDHLGTATYVTDDTGLPTQFFLNLPFGETFAEQQIQGKYVNPYKFNAKELDTETGFYYYGARYYNPRLSIWYGSDPLAEKMPSWSPYTYTFDNPVRYTDPTGMEKKDWYRDRLGNVSWHDSQADKIAGSNGEDLTRLGKSGSYLNAKGGITTLNANRTVTQDGATTQASLPAQMSPAAYGPAIGNPGAVFADFDSKKTEYSYQKLPGGTLYDPSAAIFQAYLDLESGRAAFKNIFFYERATVQATIIENAAVHGNSLKSLRPTWGYKLYQNDGTFLKNGITSQINAESRYTKAFMSDKYMEKILYPNRKAAYDWEAGENLIQKGPLNKNYH